MSEKKVGKRFLTFVLVLVMAMSLLPLNVMAAGDGEEPVEEPKSTTEEVTSDSDTTDEGDTEANLDAADEDQQTSVQSAL